LLASVTEPRIFFPRLMHNLAGYSVSPGDHTTPKNILRILGVLGLCWMLW